MVRMVNSPKDSGSMPCISVAWDNNRNLYLPFLVAMFAMLRTPFILVEIVTRSYCQQSKGEGKARWSGIEWEPDPAECELEVVGSGN